MSFEKYTKLKRPATKRACITAIASLETYLGRPANTCTQDDAIDYIATFRQGRADATVLQRYHILRGYFQFLVNMEQLTRNPFLIIPTLISLRHKKQVRPTKTLDVGQIQKILATIGLKELESRRHYAFMALLFAGGLRRSEALNIRLCNLTLGGKNQQSFIELPDTKGGTNQLQPIPYWLADAIRLVLADRKLRATDFLFPWSEKTAYRIFRNRCLDCGVNASPHSFRAAAATYLKEQGEEDRSVADFLRHKTTQMVQVYDHRARKSKAKTKQCLEDFLLIKRKFN